jgi:hypothetical protein
MGHGTDLVVLLEATHKYPFLPLTQNLQAYKNQYIICLYIRLKEGTLGLDQIGKQLVNIKQNRRTTLPG